MTILTAIQYKPYLATCRSDVSDNIRRCVKLVNEALDLGSEIIVFPELSFTGYSFLSVEDASRVAEPRDGPTFRKMSAGAKYLKCYIVWGFVEADGDNLYNSASMVGPDGKLLMTSRKMNLWANDYLWATPAQESPVTVETDLGIVSVVVCRDIIDSIPKYIPRRKIFLNKIDIVAVPVNWSGSGFPATDWVDFARDNSCAVVVANRWGVEESGSFRYDFGQGGSVIIDRDLRPHINGLKFREDSVVTANINLR